GGVVPPWGRRREWPNHGAVPSGPPGRVPTRGARRERQSSEAREAGAEPGLSGAKQGDLLHEGGGHAPMVLVRCMLSSDSTSHSTSQRMADLAAISSGSSPATAGAQGRGRARPVGGGSETSRDPAGLEPSRVMVR